MTHMDKAARENAREPMVVTDDVAESLRRNYEVALQKAHDAPRDGDAWSRWSNEALRAKQRLDAHLSGAPRANPVISAADSDNARLQARVSDLEAAQEWRPIESAPKDGTEIILHGPVPTDPRRVTAGFWTQPQTPPEYDGEPKEPRWACMHGGDDSGWMSSDGGFTCEFPPTHWRPLPAPPVGDR